MNPHLERQELDLRGLIDIENNRHQSPQGFIPTKLLDMAKAPLTSLIWT